MTGQGYSAGVRLRQRDVQREGAHFDLRPAQLSGMAGRTQALVTRVEKVLTGTLDHEPITVQWYQQVRVPSDMWMADWLPWEPTARPHPHAVLLRCCAWVELAFEPLPLE